MKHPRLRFAAVKVLIPLLAGVSVGALAGCGGAEFTYVRNDEGNTYFKIPASWQRVEQNSLEALMLGDPDAATTQVKKQLSWIVAYDAHQRPAATHLIDGTGDQPFVFARVQKLLPEERDAVSLDTLRNAVVPVALPPDKRKELEQSPGSPLKGFELLSDTVLPQKDGVRGVRVIYNYRMGGGPVQTFDQTALLGGDGTSMHVMLLRCSAACYQKRAAEFDALAQSFTVKGISG